MAVDPTKSKRVLVVHGVQSGTDADQNQHPLIGKLIKTRLNNAPLRFSRTGSVKSATTPFTSWIWAWRQLPTPPSSTSPHLRASDRFRRYRLRDVVGLTVLHQAVRHLVPPGGSSALEPARGAPRKPLRDSSGFGARRHRGLRGCSCSHQTSSDRPRKSRSSPPD